MYQNIKCYPFVTKSSNVNGKFALTQARLYPPPPQILMIYASDPNGSMCNTMSNNNSVIYGVQFKTSPFAACVII